MTLELITRTPATPTRRPPLLFIHGTNSGAWIWNEHYLPFFAGHGYAAHALSLSGHGTSAGRATLALTGVADYVADTLSIARTLEPAPVLIGHSLGGLVVQRCLGRLPLAGAALIASLPPSGLAPVIWRVATRDPLFYQQIVLLQSLWEGIPVLTDRAGPVVKRMLFAPETPEALVDSYMTRWQPESPRAVAEAATLPWWPVPFFFGPRPGLPLKVLGTEHDQLIAPELVQETARYYGTEAQILPGLGHALMLEPGWQRGAESLLAWLERLPATGSR